MGRTRVTTLLLVALATVAVGWAVIRVAENTGARTPAVPWVVDAAILVFAAVVFRLGWTVRAYQQGRRPSLNAIRAARTFVLAKSTALAGALLAGWYLAQVLLVVGDLAIEAQRTKALAAGIAVVCAVLLAVIGMVVEAFCQLPPGRSGQDGAGLPEEGTTAGAAEG